MKGLLHPVAWLRAFFRYEPTPEMVADAELWEDHKDRVSRRYTGNGETPGTMSGGFGDHGGFGGGF